MGRMGVSAGLACAVALLAAGCVQKQPEPTAGGPVAGWPRWGGDDAGTHFSADEQITPENVKDLKVAWTYRTGDLAGPGQACRPGLRGHADPGQQHALSLLAPKPHRALDPTTGRQKWMFDAHPDTNGATVITCRGVSYWKDSQPNRRSAPSASSPAPSTARCGRWTPTRAGRAKAFGDHGKVDLHEGLGFIEKPGLWGISSAPTIVGDMVITGSKIIDFHNTDMPGGVVRALDARTGKVVWAFTAAPPDQPQGDAQHYPRSAPNVWAPMSVDVERKLIFLPTGTPQVDSYVGKADWDYYGSSVVALNTDTGQVVWHYQLVHKDIWDYDTPVPAAAVRLQVAGRQDDPRARPGHQDGLHLCAQPRDRPADLPGEGNARSPPAAAEGPVADPADPGTARARSPDHQIPGLRHFRLRAGRPLGLPEAFPCPGQ